MLNCSDKKSQLQVLMIVWDVQANDSNFEKIDLWQILHANGNTKISSVETSVVKELVLVIQQLWH